MSEILSRATDGMVSVEAPFDLVDEGLCARVDATRPVTVRAYLAAQHAGDAVERARRDLGHLQAFGLRPIGELETRVVHEEDWAEAWKSHFPVLRVGRRLVIRPTWREHAAAPGDVVIALDPGMAFGTGLHPTTRLCLAAIEQLADDGGLAGKRVLDVGCGSGILGVAAALLGADSVRAVDTDPIAVEATQRQRRTERPRDQGPGTPRLAPNVGWTVRRRAGQPDRVAADRPRVRVAQVGRGGRPAGRQRHLRRPRAGGASPPSTGVGLRVVNRWSETDWVAVAAVAE